MLISFVSIIVVQLYPNKWIYFDKNIMKYKLNIKLHFKPCVYNLKHYFLLLRSHKVTNNPSKRITVTWCVLFFHYDCNLNPKYITIYYRLPNFIYHVFLTETVLTKRDRNLLVAQTYKIADLQDLTFNLIRIYDILYPSLKEIEYKHYDTNICKSCLKLVIYKSKKRVICIKTIGQRVTFNKEQHCNPKLWKNTIWHTETNSWKIHSTRRKNETVYVR